MAGSVFSINIAPVLVKGWSILRSAWDECFKNEWCWSTARCILTCSSSWKRRNFLMLIVELDRNKISALLCPSFVLIQSTFVFLTWFMNDVWWVLTICDKYTRNLSLQPGLAQREFHNNWQTWNSSCVIFHIRVRLALFSAQIKRRSKLAALSWSVRNKHSYKLGFSTSHNFLLS